MKNKKLLFVSTIIMTTLILSGCGQKAEKNILPADLAMTESQVKVAVDGWKIHTNPAYRYELRFPRDWQSLMTGEDGVLVKLYSDKKESLEDIKIIAYSNWKENYSLEDFYAKQYQNLLATVEEKETVKIAGADGYWFKKVKNFVPEKPDAEVDVITLSLADRIIEFVIIDNFETSRTILNSLKFYGNTGIEIE